ncbi:thioredoxin family protein [Candidatus Accumulibacter sp. ACC007]|uniref:DUF1223 domain-containing protein n=1 Tax=Candidatus Accumulibacter sp. ACC007 TaxID=2823333 RepID=UPI0025BD8ABA|nr:DUF1223 domain-containing protein [Candidatus Accumulibacter sp. ACC007]
MSSTRRWSPAVAVLAVLCLAPSPAAQAAGCAKQSPAHRVALVELYTSEGCSSCPPADQWLGELSQRFSAEQLVALSLHVDYWDYIGWQDPFAQPAFAERQRWLARLAKSSTVYTPEVFTSMKELRAWHTPAHFAERVEKINRLPAAADIALQMRQAGDNAVDLEARFTLREGARAGRAAEAIVIIYENQLRSDIRAGENSGVTLQHDRVVRFWSIAFPLGNADGSALWRQTLKIPADWQRKQLGVAAFVQDPQGGEVLQALAMPGCLQPAAATAARS